MADSIALDVGGTEVAVTNPGKVYFKQRGETKLDLVEYYLAVGEPLLRTLQGRPLLLERFPDGAGGKSWFQKRVPGVRAAVADRPPSSPRRTARRATPSWRPTWPTSCGRSTSGASASTCGPRTRTAPASRTSCASTSTPRPAWASPRCARRPSTARELLDELGIEVHLKTSGSRGLHLYVGLEPRWDSYEVRAAAVALARELERRHPDLVTAQWWKEERGARVFVDFNQNAPHKTVFGAWCVPPRVGGQVSTPITWDELPEVDPDALTLATVPGRVAAHGDPWEGKVGRPQDLEPLLERSAPRPRRRPQDAPGRPCTRSSRTSPRGWLRAGPSANLTRGSSLA